MVPRRWSRKSMRRRASAASRLRKTREGWDFASAAETNSQDQQPRTCPKPLVPINAFGETNSQDQQPRRSTRAECNSTPAVNLDNENPTLTALGKAHPHEPESVRKNPPNEIMACNAAELASLASGRTADGGARFARHGSDGRWGSLRSPRTDGGRLVNR